MYNYLKIISYLTEIRSVMSDWKLLEVLTHSLKKWRKKTYLQQGWDKIFVDIQH